MSLIKLTEDTWVNPNKVCAIEQDHNTTMDLRRTNLVTLFIKVEGASDDIELRNLTITEATDIIDKIQKAQGNATVDTQDHFADASKKVEDRMKRCLSKIIDIKCTVEGCCLEIQQNLLPELSVNSTVLSAIDAEVSEIDNSMTELESILNAEGNY